MITKSKKSLGKIALRGGRTAIKKLIEERKKNNDYLVVSMKGKVVKVKARSL